MASPLQALQRSGENPQERPAGWFVSVHGHRRLKAPTLGAPLAKDSSHYLRGAPRLKRLLLMP